jgi:hypothetical protein
MNDASQGIYNRPRATTYSQLFNSPRDTAIKITTPLIQTHTSPTTTNRSHNISSNMAKHTKRYSQSAPQGFMEPIAGATYHEDIYGVSQFDEDRAESYAFDLYESSDDDDDDDKNEDEGDRRGNIDKAPFKRRRLVSGPSSASRGVIKKPKCKAQISSSSIDFNITDTKTTQTNPD